MLEVRDLRFGYSWPVLQDVSFRVGRGEVLAVLGPNGSGKSTLLKILARILKAESGAITLAGRNLTNFTRRELANMIGYVAQQSPVRFPLTAVEYVLQGRFSHGSLLGFESEEDVRAAKSAMEMTETLEFSQRRIDQLSGGERQRVMLARALASGPSLLVLDEPVANLDISQQVKMLHLVKGLSDGRSISAVVVTHEVNLAAQFAQRILMLKSGGVLACGATGEVLNEQNLATLYDTAVVVDRNPASGSPRVTVLGPDSPPRQTKPD